MNRSFWKNKRVFITGHTGFKGGWLSLWLHDMGARVYGYSLQPPTEPNLYTVANIDKIMEGCDIADICDSSCLAGAIKKASPEVVFHLAAQPLVRRSYDEPVETYAANVMGTINLLEAVRQTRGIRAVVNITTDKCYENQEWVWGYRENEPLGGHDPYSSSKACAEIVTAAWRRSYFDKMGVALASVRAGNVIGGGDWGQDRLIPDFFRSLHTGEVLTIRSPKAVRPWQYVLEPLAGYLTLAERLFSDGAEFAEAWNFGPDDNNSRSVQWIVDYLCSSLPDASWRCDGSIQPHEANQLKLDSSKARTRLNWQSRWNLQIALDYTINWFEKWQEQADMLQVCLNQVHDYEETYGDT